MKHAPFLVAITAGILLSGCSFFPGMSFEGTVPSGDQSVDISHRYQITAITPELLSAQAHARDDIQIGKTNFILSQQLSTYQYKVGPHDVLSIIIWGDPTKTSIFTPMGAPGTLTSTNPAATGFEVDSDGKIYFPYVKDPLKVTGQTIKTIQKELADDLSSVIHDPQVTVAVAQYGSQQYQIAGVVAKPGLYPITDKPLTVSQAVAAAGGVIPQVAGLTSASNTIARPLGDLSRVVYMHNNTVELLNLEALEQYGDQTQDRRVGPGDIIRVPDNSFEQIHVIGEVHTPGNYSMNNTRLTLSQVLGDAGGIDIATADTARIFVFRGAYQEPHIYWLDASSPDAMLLANDFELQPQDVVYVGTAGVAGWNRVITQILPTVQTLYFSKVLTGL